MPPRSRHAPAYHVRRPARRPARLGLFRRVREEGQAVRWRVAEAPPPVLPLTTPPVKPAVVPRATPQSPPNPLGGDASAPPPVFPQPPVVVPMPPVVPPAGDHASGRTDGRRPAANRAPADHRPWGEGRAEGAAQAERRGVAEGDLRPRPDGVHQGLHRPRPGDARNGPADPAGVRPIRSQDPRQGRQEPVRQDRDFPHDQRAGEGPRRAVRGVRHRRHDGV